MIDDELDYWRYTAFKLAQALCSCTAQHMGNTRVFGGIWYAEAAEVQEHYRSLGLSEHKIGNPNRGNWKPAWSNLYEDASSKVVR